MKLIKGKAKTWPVLAWHDKAWMVSSWAVSLFNNIGTVQIKEWSKMGLIFCSDWLFSVSWKWDSSVLIYLDSVMQYHCPHWSNLYVTVESYINWIQILGRKTICNSKWNMFYTLYTSSCTLWFKYLIGAYNIEL